MSVPQYWKANWGIFLFQICFQTGFFAIGLTIVLIINQFFNEDMDYACLGTMMALCGMFASVVTLANNVNFRMTVLMGQTRRYFLLWQPLTMALLTLLGWLTAFLLYRLEYLLYGILYPGFTEGIPVGEVFRWWIIALFVTILPVSCLFLGALHAKFGQKGFFVIWMALCFAPMTLTHAVDGFQSGRNNLLAKLGGLIMLLVESLTPLMWAAVGAAALLAMLGFSVWVYLKAEVRI
ncbi:MAG: hypothetical protein K2O18_07650 [Oscillospiraceae bacterium]|nr:hypothetical protein [Oscillospiraceae bacterium]